MENKDLENWLNKNNDLNFVEFDNNSSIKTNFLATFRNFVNLSKYLKIIKECLIYLKNLINIDEIKSEILKRIRVEKSKIQIPYSLNIGQKTIYNDQFNNVDYNIERIDEKTFHISNITEPNWNVDNLIICVKNNDGSIIYPKIKTLSNKIIIQFDNVINTNYNILAL